MEIPIMRLPRRYRSSQWR